MARKADTLPEIVPQDEIHRTPLIHLTRPRAILMVVILFAAEFALLNYWFPI